MYNNIYIYKCSPFIDCDDDDAVIIAVGGGGQCSADSASQSSESSSAASLSQSLLISTSLVEHTGICSVPCSTAFALASLEPSI